MYFLTEDDELLKKYNDIWNKVSNSMKKINSEPFYNRKFLETKMKYYGMRLRIFMIKECLK